jgi:hypothetical protein
VTSGVHVYYTDTLLRFSISLAAVPERRVPDVLTLANLLNGRQRACSRFYINPESHWLLFALDTILVGEPSLEHVRRGVEGLWPADFYYPAFAGVLWAGWDAAAAYRCAETLDDDPGDTPLHLVV